MPAVRVAVLSAWFLAGATWAAAQVAEPSLKAAFLLNFVKFTEWPASAVPAGGPLRLCISDPAVADALAPLVSGRSSAGHTLTVTPVETSADFSSCALLYLTSKQVGAARPRLESVRQAPILVVSDGPDALVAGGTAYFYVDTDRMRFAISPGGATARGLKISSQLLSLAKLVRDGER